MAKTLFVHPEAGVDAQEAYDYIADRNLSAATRFADEIRIAFDDIEQQPEPVPEVSSGA